MIIMGSNEFYGVVCKQNRKLPTRPHVQLASGAIIDLSLQNFTTMQIKTEQEVNREIGRSTTRLDLKFFIKNINNKKETIE